MGYKTFVEYQENRCWNRQIKHIIYFQIIIYLIHTHFGLGTSRMELQKEGSDFKKFIELSDFLQKFL